MNFSYSQTDFTSGILDPRMYNRIDFQRYYSAAKEIENALVMPQGGVTKRFGTRFVKNYGASNFDNFRLFTFQYDTDTEYLLVVLTTSIEIFLGNTLVESVATTYLAADIKNVEGVQVDNRYLFLNKIYPIKSLERGANAPIAITGFNNANSTLSAAALPSLIINRIYPAKFGGTTLPSTLPVLSRDKIYFIVPSGITDFKIYETVKEAQQGINAFEINDAGTAATVIVQNTWVFNDYQIEILPPFDFGDVNYSAVTFTPSAVSGNAVTITASAAIFTADYVGGAIQMNGGALIFTVLNSATELEGYTTRPFATVAEIIGTQVFLGKPAWSAARGYPSTAATFQNRLYLAGTTSIPGGLWASEVNDYNNFDVTSAEPESGFDYIFPSNNIKHLVATRGLLVLSQQDVFVSPINSELPITPQTANFIPQVGYGSSDITPVSTDNQVFFVDSSNSSLRSTRFSFENGSYVVDDVSIIAKSIFGQPVEIEKFDGTTFVDGNFVFIINDRFDLVILQTLTRQNVSAFTLHKSANLFPSNFYRMTSFIDSAYFLVGRANVTIGPVQVSTAINLELSSLIVAGGPVFTDVRACKFVVGIEPISIPQISNEIFYYCIRISADNYIFFESYDDAIQNKNRIVITGFGVLNRAEFRLYENTGESLILEEMDFTVSTDCTQSFSGIPRNNFSSQFPNQLFAVVSDGNFVDNIVSANNGTIETDSDYASVSYGFLFKPKLVPLGINIRLDTGNNYYKKKTITEMYVSYFETFSFTMQGFENSQEGIDVFINDEITPPRPSGFQLFTPMTGYWRGDDMQIVISQNLPLPWTIRSIDYIIKQD